jgi:hypothetical protein
VYWLASPKYHEPIEDWDVEDNYDPSIPEWVDENYLKTSIHNDANVNVLKEALPSKRSQKQRNRKKKMESKT